MLIKSFTNQKKFFTSFKRILSLKRTVLLVVFVGNFSLLSLVKGEPGPVQVTSATDQSGSHPSIVTNSTKPLPPVPIQGSVVGTPTLTSEAVSSTSAPSMEPFLSSLTLTNESVSQTLALLGKWTNRVIILEDGLPRRNINLDISMPLSFDEAVAILKSRLAAEGIAVTPLGEKAWRAVPINKAKSNAPTMLKREDLLKKTSSQEICCCLFRLNNLTAREGARAISQLTTSVSSSVVTLDKANSLFITDTLANLQQLDRFFQENDKVANIQEAILWLHPKNASAENLKKIFEDLQNGALKYYLLGNTSFTADKNTNTLVISTPKGCETMIRKAFETFDTATDPLVQYYVFRIQHGSSKEITGLIKKLIQQQKETVQNSTSTDQQNSPTQTFSKYFSVECDERLNAIVAQGTPTDRRQIQHLLDQIDVVLPQVRIEVIIAEVKLTDGQASGLESFGYQQHIQTEQKYDRNGAATGTTSTIPHKITAGLASLPGGLSIGNITSFWPKFGIDTILNTAKINSNVKIVSSPTLLTTHAREAKLSVVETRPYISSIQTKTGSGATDGDVSNSNVEKVDAGIELSVKPLIGLNGTIQMEIDQKIDNFTTNSMHVGSANSKIEIPFINKRQIQSFVSAQSGDMIVLAGLKKQDILHNKKKMLILGDIPLFGDLLFTSKSEQEEESELIVFIRPILLPDASSAKKDTEQYTSNLTPASQQVIRSYQLTEQASQPDLNDPHRSEQKPVGQNENTSSKLEKESSRLQKSSEAEPSQKKRRKKTLFSRKRRPIHQKSKKTSFISRPRNQKANPLFHKKPIKQKLPKRRPAKQPLFARKVRSNVQPVSKKMTRVRKRPLKKERPKTLSEFFGKIFRKPGNKPLPQKPLIRQAQKRRQLTKVL